MKYFINPILVSACFLFACNSGKVATDKDIQSIVTTCITSTIGQSDSARYYYKLMPPIDTSQNTKRYNDSIKSLLDTALVYLLVQDSLNNISPEDKTDFHKFIAQYNHDHDASLAFIHDEKSIQHIDLSVLEKETQIRIKTKEERINDELRLIGSFCFSKIFFNASKTQALVCINFFVQHVGYGEVLMLQKINGSWIVSKRERTWVS